MESHYRKHSKYTELLAKRVGRGGKMRTSLRKRRYKTLRTVRPKTLIIFNVFTYLGPSLLGVTSRLGISPLRIGNSQGPEKFFPEGLDN